MNGRRPRCAADPEATYISLYCAEPSHADQPWLVASFVREWAPEVVPGGQRLWLESPRYWRAHTPTVRLAGRSAARLSGDQHVTRAEFEADPGILERGDSGTRYRFECKRCGLTIERNGRAVDEVFDKLAGVGIFEVTLRALGAMF